jgi:hypothetical protein
VRGRHLTTAVTLLVLLGILVAAGLYGLDSLLKPLPGDSSKETAGCSTTRVKKGERIRAHQVQVSVFNAGTRSGLADETLGALRARGFRKGEAGNAPSGSKVKRAQVWTTQRHDAAARLVALQLGAKTKVRFVDTDLGPGVDVVVGNGFDKLAKAKRVLVVKKKGAACLPTKSPSGSTSG